MVTGVEKNKKFLSILISVAVFSLLCLIIFADAHLAREDEEAGAPQIEEKLPDTGESAPRAAMEE